MMRRHIITIVFASIPGAAGAAAAAESEKQALLWIRAGALSPGEVEADPEEAPRLREMVLEGVTASELSLPDPLPADPKAIAGLLFDGPSRERLRESRGAPAADVGPPSEVPEPAAGDAAWTHPVVSLLEKRFGRPPPPGAEEEASILRIRAVLGTEVEPGEPADPAKEPAAHPPASPAGAAGEEGKPDPGSLEISRRAIGALEDGAPLVIALEPVQDPSRSRSRDAALGWLAASLRGKDVFLLVLSARVRAPGSTPEGAPARAVLTVVGPEVRPGMIVGERKPLASAAATAFRLIGVPPPPRHETEPIDALKR